nr:unnamed protein product [Digitaria exilis]
MIAAALSARRVQAAFLHLLCVSFLDHTCAEPRISRHGDLLHVHGAARLLLRGEAHGPAASSCAEQRGEAPWRQGEQSNPVAQRRDVKARPRGGPASRAALQPSDDDVEAICCVPCPRAPPCVVEPRHEASELELPSPFSSISSSPHLCSCGGGTKRGGGVGPRLPRALAASSAGPPRAAAA